MRGSDRGTGRSSKQLEACIDRARREERIVYVTPGPVSYWADLAFKIAKDLGAVTYSQPAGRMRFGGEGGIEFVSLDRFSRGYRPTPGDAIVHDHAAEV